MIPVTVLGKDITLLTTENGVLPNNCYPCSLSLSVNTIFYDRTSY